VQRPVDADIGQARRHAGNRGRLDGRWRFGPDDEPAALEDRDDHERDQQHERDRDQQATPGRTRRSYRLDGEQLVHLLTIRADRPFRSAAPFDGPM
jgi:hypothetical protein